MIRYFFKFPNYLKFEGMPKSLFLMHCSLILIMHTFQLHVSTLMLLPGKLRIL